jgi:hypothetical protein
VSVVREAHKRIFGGGTVIVTHSHAHAVTRTTGKIIDFASVPAPHILVEVAPNGAGGKPKIKAVFCSAIESIDEVVSED